MTVWVGPRRSTRLIVATLREKNLRSDTHWIACLLYYSNRHDAARPEKCRWSARSRTAIAELNCLRERPDLREWFFRKSFACQTRSNRVLRETAYLITPSLTYLFNLSLKTCTFPDEWKSAVVCPIFKNRGSRNNPSNYRPVSLLSAVGKTMDALQSRSLNYSLLSLAEDCK